ncbi:MAG: FecR domain-containing protein [Chloroflexi bacterium]|nr:MAG: FecR domain-containing protein [Chloroflexota bacterium]TMG19554.1 MAG: FecR domain-containing protein [Chloroflexota bacterium]TMG64881.1 MAG: FecR domain-containing protein [Chloroflexota bacterium]
MATVAAKAPPRRRGGRRLLILFLILIVAVVGVVVWLNVAASAQVNASATLTVYQPAASTSSNGSDFLTATTGAVVHAGASVKTDAKGRAAITLPDGTLTRLASDTTLKFDSAHFTKSGSLHDVTLSQKIGRTFTNVQHLASGATFDVNGASATASVRGTKFEIYILADGTMTVKVFVGTVRLHNATASVQINAGQQATANPNGTISQPIPIVPDSTDPFGPALAASDAVAIGTTPGTEQDFIGAPLHNGEQQQYTYSYAGGSLVKASLGYPGSAMKLTVQAPDNQKYVATGTLPTVEVHNAPPGVYKIIVDGVSGLGTAGEEPFIAVASLESCASADVQQNGAVHRGYTSQDLIDAVQSGQVSGISNLKLRINDDSAAGAIITGGGTYNGVGWSGSVVLVAHNGVLDIMPTGGSVFGMNVPAQQVVQQIAAAIGQDPSNLSPGFMVDRLFTCKSVMIVDGRVR